MPDQSPRLRRCAICGTAAGPRPGNPFAPFCSDRCKLVDLSRWLNEEYVVSSPVPWLAPDAVTVGGGAPEPEHGRDPEDSEGDGGGQG